MVFGKWSSCLYLDPWVFPSYFILLQKGSERATGVGIWEPPMVGAGAFGLQGEAKGLGLAQPGEGMSLGSLTTALQHLQGVTEEMNPGFLQQCITGLQERTDINWSTRDSVQIQGDTFPPRGEPISGRGCPERLPPWRFSSPNWVKPWATWSDLRDDLALKQEVGIETKTVFCFTAILE